MGQYLRLQGRNFQIDRSMRDEQLSQEDLIARIQRLSDGPQQALTTVELRALLTQVPDEEIPAFSELSIAGLSPDACKFCNRYLKDHPDEKSLWTKFLRSWAEEDPATMLATLDQEPSEERYRNKLLLFGGIHPSGPEVEQADGTITMSTADGVVYASLAERERQVAEAGINAGYSMVEIRQAIDASHKVISSRHSFFEWTDDILEAAELEILRTKLTDFEKSQTPKNSRIDYAAVYHSAIWNSATLPDQPSRQEVCESLAQE